MLWTLSGEQAVFRSPYIFEQQNQPRKSCMSLLWLQISEMRNQSDRLPAEGGPATSEKKSKPLALSFYLSTWPTSFTSHSSGIRRLVSRLDILPNEFVKWRGIAADRNQWRAVCGSKMPSATKETPTSSQEDIWAELRYGNVPSWVQKLTRKLQMSKQNEQKERKEKKYSQTSRLENPEKLQLHHNHEKFLSCFRLSCCSSHNAKCIIGN
jgi:hypothetical protein